MADGSGLPGAWKSVIGFAGGGGSSVALKLATGCDPDVAMNHWMTAVRAHQRHFPLTEHHCTDVWETDPMSVLPGERIAFGWFSPDCTDFSKAKGKAPRAERIRGLGWSIIPWAVARRIGVIMLENVEEFAQWGPVYRCPDDVRAKGVPGEVGEPIKALRGTTFARWRSRLEALGYVVDWRIVNAADFGAPTTRKRLYLVARCDGKPIVWPERTHAPRKDAERLGLKPWRGACEIIDWSLDCPSIFLTPPEVKDLRRTTGKRVNRPLVAATLKRIARGMERYVIGAAESYLVNITQRGWGGDRAHAVRAPLPTLTSSRGGEYALVGPSLVSVAHGEEARAWPVDEPARTQTGKHDKALVAASLHQLNTRDVGCGAMEPLRTHTGRGHHGLAAAHLVRQFGTGMAADAREPAPTVMADGGGKTQLVAAHLGAYYGQQHGGPVDEPQLTGTGKDRHALTLAWLEQANTDMVGHPAQDPLSTIVGRGTTQRLIEARLEQDGGPVGRRGAVLAFFWDHFGLPTAAEWSDPAATLQGRLKFGLVLLTPRGERIGSAEGVTAEPPAKEIFMIVDIGLRMLTPAELAGAMGLPPEYDLATDLHGAPISKTHQTQMIGNMVSPPPAAALIAANCPHLIKPGHVMEAA